MTLARGTAQACDIRQRFWPNDAGAPPRIIASYQIWLEPGFHEAAPAWGGKLPGV